MQPLDSFFIAFLRGAADHFLIIRHHNMPAIILILINVPISFTETIDQDPHILVTTIHHTGHGNNAPFNPEFLLKL